MTLEGATCMTAEELRVGGGEAASWRLLATLEVCSLALLVLALGLHALHRATRRAPTAARSLLHRRVLVTKGDTDLGQELARQFAREGCYVTLLKPSTSTPQSSNSSTTELSDSINVPRNEVTTEDIRRTKLSAVQSVREEGSSSRYRGNGLGESTDAQTEGMMEDGVTASLVEVIYCNSRNHEEIRAAGERAGELDVLVVCGAESAASGLDALAKTVSEEIHSNLHMLEELSLRLRGGGSAVWVCARGRGTARESYAGAARALQRVARTLLHDVARRRGCRAVWCEGRGERARELAARVVHAVARDGAPPTSADVFREVAYRFRMMLYELFTRFCKLWT